ncbi:hypothetical protein HBN50_11470 [Halobacteriovorax sp. GB3]|uniref:beta strand repeat-containing protein n=1 Tax=Halobacteriovorax sp. GB3 TaxID=2719615 RepID=UPI0023627902|nr:hypothetical protein [Halobacteriovorax sp. GB3]MDD0853720.1 hypothetical protein [Halobacteriovorax sp. GB3]
MFFKKSLFYCLFILSFCSLAETISYSGRLVQPSTGIPLTGPVDLSIKIYQETTPGNPVVQCDKAINGVTLNNGVFNLNLNYASSCDSNTRDLSEIIESAMASNQAIYIEVTDATNAKIYPMQVINFAPMALYAKRAASVALADKSLDVAKLTSTCTNNQVIKSDGAGGFICANDETGLTSAIENVSSGEAINVSISSNDATINVLYDNTTIGLNSNQLEVKDASIGTTKLSDNAVSTLKIQDNSVTSTKIPANTISATHIQDGVISDVKISSVSATKISGVIADVNLPAITTTHIQDGTITNDDLADSTIALTKLDPSSCSSDQVVKFDLILNQFICADSSSLSTNAWTENGGDIYRSSGNVGIGTNSPGALLHVANGSAKSSVSIDGLNGGTLNFLHSGAQRASIDYTNSTGMMTLETLYSGIIFKTGSGGSSIEVMRMSGNGNIAIGKTTGTEKLDVNGNIKGTQLCIGSDCRSSWPSSNAGTVTSVTGASTGAIDVANTSTTPEISVRTDGASLEVNGSNNLQVKDSGITNSKIATGLDASKVSTGTLPDAVLSSTVTKLGQTIESAEITDGTIADADISSTASITWTKIDKSGASASDIGAVSTSRLVNTGTGLLGGGALSSDLTLSADVDAINFWTKTTNDLSYSTGNVMVGSSTPTDKLEIETGNIRFRNIGDAASRGLIFSENDTVYHSMSLVYDGRLSGVNNKMHIMGDEGTLDEDELVTITRDGRVGIGTTSPSLSLDVQGPASFSGFYTNSQITYANYDYTDLSYLLLAKTSSNDKVYGRIYGHRGSDSAIPRPYYVDVIIDTSSAYTDVGEISKIYRVDQKVSLAQITYKGENWWALKFDTGSDFHANNIGFQGYKLNTDAEAFTFIDQDNADLTAEVSVKEYTRLAGTLYSTKSNNIGIGTIAPTEKLEVSGNIKATSFIGDGSSLTGINASSSSNTTDAIINADSDGNSSGAVLFQTGGSTKATLTNNGSFGLGTSTPESLFNLVGGNLQLGQTTDSYYSTLSSNILTFNRNGVSYIDNADANGEIAIRTGGTGNIDFLVSSTGKVGIGTSTPSGNLHVKSTDTIGLSTDPNAAKEKAAIHIEGNTSDHRILMDGNEIIHYDNNFLIGSYNSKSTTNGSIEFKTGNTANTFNTKMNIKADGTIGMGVTDQIYPLVVKNDSVSNAGIALEASTSTNLLAFFHEGAGNDGEIFIRDETNTNKVKLDSNGVSYFNGGNLGIGVSAPDQKLDVAGNIEVSDNNSFGRAIASTTDRYAFTPYSANVNTLTGLGPSAPFGNGMLIESDALIGFVESDANSLVGYMNLNDKNFIWDGNIGLGTTTPQAKLTVTSSSKDYFVNMPLGGQTSTEDAGGYNYILLHRAYEGTALNEHYVNGKIHFVRGGTAAWNRKFTVEVNSSCSYTKCRGSYVAHNEDTLLVYVTYNGIKYMALRILSNSRLYSGTFTGFMKNTSSGSAESLTLVYDDDVTSVESFGLDGTTEIEDAISTARIYAKRGVKNSNHGKLVANYDGTTRTVDIPWTGDDVLQLVGYTKNWSAQGPDLRDTSGCGSGDNPSHRFVDTSNEWNGAYTVHFSKRVSDSAPLIRLEWNGWNTTLYNAANTSVATGLGQVSATLYWTGSHWEIQHMMGRVGNTNFNCY